MNGPGGGVEIMGKRGPRPKPTALRLLHGDRSDRINNDEPLPEQGIPECPSSDPEVREVWEYTVRQLTAMGCLTMADRDALNCYCEAVATHRKASAVLAKSPVLIRARSDSNTLIRNPALIVQRDAAALIARYAQHFGLSPSARSEIRKGGGQDAPNAARYLNA